MTGRRVALGVSTWLWHSPLNDASLEAIARKVQGWGFDVIELPFERHDDWDPRRAAALLVGLGLGATTCAVMSDGRDLTTADRGVTAATQRYLEACLEGAVAVGAGVVAGPVYAPVGRLWRLDPPGRAAAIRRLVEGLKPCAAYAAERGVRLALEPLNRFETSLINTVEQALEVIEAVASPGLGLCLDTFHMNIEEKDPVAAVRLAAGRIVHVQACGTDRGAPGADQFGWPAFIGALLDVGYTGSLTIESFAPGNEAIARAASVWRPLAPSQDDLAITGLAFLRGLLDTHPSRPGMAPGQP